MATVKTKVTDIGFFDDQCYQNMDETEFDTWDEEELAQLWWEFCKENDLIWVSKKEIEKEEYE